MVYSLSHALNTKGKIVSMMEGTYLDKWKWDSKRASSPFPTKNDGYRMKDLLGSQFIQLIQCPIIGITNLISVNRIQLL